jgi:hypothetical protein
MKSLAVTNTLAYFGAVLEAREKRFLEHSYLKGKENVFNFERFFGKTSFFVSMLLVKLMQNKLECSNPGTHFQPCLTFEGKARAYYCGVSHGACISKFTLS